ncbi:MAG: hypothetical protein WCQ20_06855 [Synechococcaceae cyanobacterium ELA739]
MAAALRDAGSTGKLVLRKRRRRQHKRSTVLRRLLEPVWIEIRTMLRTPLYRWSLGTLASLALLYWLLGVVLPSSNPDRFRPSQQGQLTR